MKIEELDKYLADHSELLSWKISDDERYLHIRFGEEEEGLSIDMSKIKDITLKQLDKKLLGCRNVDQMTRITGYFAKVGGFNKGKIAELRDRVRNGDQIH